jgi:serine/threonine-protein kinase
MLTGRLPQRDFDPPSRIRPDLGHEWDRFITRALSVSPKDRFSSAEQMLDDLETLAHRWEKRKQRICRLPQIPQAPSPRFLREHRPRRQEALKVGPREARNAFGLDPLCQPAAYAGSKFSAAAQGTLADQVTGLTWQTSGSAYPMTWRRAHRYVEQLNADGFGGSAGWRLPTVDELTSLLRPVPRGRDHCLEPVFDPARKRLWSSDRKSFIAAWYVDADLGFVHWQDFGCRNYVKAVRSAPP